MTNAVGAEPPDTHLEGTRAGGRRKRFTPSIPLVDAKLHPPAHRPDIIDRTRILDQLEAEPQAPIVVIAAPPGYGKTTILADWSRAAQRDVVWLTLDAVDNEPSVLLTNIAAGVDRIQPIDSSLASALSVQGPAILAAAVPRLASELHRWPRPGLLIFDDAHRLVDQTCVDALTLLLANLPDGFRVAIAGRSIPDLRLPRMRAQRILLEIGPADLAFDMEETERVAAAAGHPLSREQARELTARTEGWPAAVYLAALARRPGSGTVPAINDVNGRDGYIAEFIRSELHADFTDADLTLLTRTSILEVIEAPVAASVSGIPDAPERLADLARRNGLIVRVGGNRDAYRCHQLLRDYLLAELERREPGALPGLHLGAAAVLAASGRLGDAVEHSIASGDVDEMARSVGRAFVATYYGGHLDRLDRWLGSFTEQDLVRHPSLAVVAGWVNAIGGRPEQADRMADIAERSTIDDAPMFGTPTFASGRAMLLAAMARHGPDEMLKDATLAAGAVGEDSIWRSVTLWLLGGAHILRGDVDTADANLAEAVAVAARVGTPAFFPLALRASLAMARGDWRSAGQFATESHAIFEETHLSDVVSALLVHAVAARVAIHRGDLARGRDELVHAQLVRPVASHALPWASVLGLIEMARAYLAMSDPAGARSVVSGAELILRRRPNLGVMPAAVEELRHRLDESARVIGGPSTLTPAELRILPLLSTHLTFEEIGDRLGVSRHTVKSHVMAIYGKLGASSRSEAMARSVEIGLLEPYFGFHLVTPAG